MAEFSEISAVLGAHYGRTFAEHGTNAEGVDWGASSADHRLRLDRMLAVTEIGRQPGAPQSLLDVGCGYGSLLDVIKERGLELSYIGMEICDAMLDAARARHPDAEWRCSDILQTMGDRNYDYAVCNGILTQKLDVSQRKMDAFLKAVVTRMFHMTRVGIAFNVMTTHVNFTVANLYYRNPAELMAWCMSELTPRVRLDHAYPLFEYTLYLYHEDAPGLEYGAHRGEVSE